MIFDKIRPTVYESDKIDDIKQSLEGQGFAVISVKTVDLAALKQLYAKDVSEVTGNYVGFPELWSPSVDLPEPTHYGLGGEQGIAQGDAAWYIKTNQEIINIYQQVLNNKELVCSMDAVGFSQDNDTPLELRDRIWLHVDQNPDVFGAHFKSYQSIFYAEDSFGERAGTVVVPASHLDWNNHDYSNQKSHFQIITDPKYFEKAVKLEIPSGCLLMFSSHLVHQGYYGPHRLCFMISYGLKSDRTEVHRKRKVVLYLSGHRSNHWSQFGMHHGHKIIDSQWNMLQPRLEKSGLLSNLVEEVESLKDMPMADCNWYEEWYDNLVPAERLKLL
jgi:hypothetical protein